MPIFYITHETLSRTIYRVQAESEERAFEITMNKYDPRKENVRESYVTAYHTSLPEEIFWSEAREAGRE